MSAEVEVDQEVLEAAARVAGEALLEYLAPHIEAAQAGLDETDYGQWAGDLVARADSTPEGEALQAALVAELLRTATVAVEVTW